MNFLNFAVKLLFPPRCVLCGEVLPITFKEESDFEFDKLYPYTCSCTECSGKIPDVPIITTIESNDAVCVSSLHYKGEGRDSVLRLKRYGYRNSAIQLGRLSSQAVIKIFDNNSFDVITYVPMDKKEQKKKKFNQARLLAEAIGKNLGIEVQNLLIKSKNVRKQHTLNAQERRKNANHAYSALPDTKLENKTVLLVDDIVTTGSTLGDCCRALKEAGAYEVYCVTAARSVLE